ncbi:MAG: hypothetical protein RL648_1197, partial [Verrucomicrobiota bacterium]
AAVELEGVRLIENVSLEGLLK